MERVAEDIGCTYRPNTHNIVVFCFKNLELFGDEARARCVDHRAGMVNFVYVRTCH